MTANEQSDDEIMNRSDKGKPTTASEKHRAGGGKQPSLKGLERRRKSSRRVEARRNMDAGKGNAPVAKESRKFSLADRAAEQLAELYNQLFDVFPAIEAAIVDLNSVGEHREALAAMRQMLNILHRQEERVKLLKEMEQECQADAVQLELSREMAETFMEFLTEFASDHWIAAVKQIRVSQ